MGGTKDPIKEWWGGGGGAQKVLPCLEGGGGSHFVAAPSLQLMTTPLGGLYSFLITERRPGYSDLLKLIFREAYYGNAIDPFVGNKHA